MAAVRALKIGDEVQPPGTWIVRVSPVEMKDGRVLNWHPPQPVAFSLVESKRLCDRAVPKRRNILGNLEARSNGTYQPTNPQAAADVIADLWSAVLHSFAAIEAMANAMIDRLAETDTVTVGKKNRVKTVAQPEMIWLGIEDKLKFAVPVLDGGRDVKTDEPDVWRRFTELKKLRDGLVHTREDGYDPDPTQRTAYDQLILGEGDDCWRKAFDVVRTAWPGFLAEHAVEHLLRDSAEGR